MYYFMELSFYFREIILKKKLLQTMHDIRTFFIYLFFFFFFDNFYSNSYLENK